MCKKDVYWKFCEKCKRKFGIMPKVVPSQCLQARIRQPAYGPWEYCEEMEENDHVVPGYERWQDCGKCWDEYQEEKEKEQKEQKEQKKQAKKKRQEEKNRHKMAQQEPVNDNAGSGGETPVDFEDDAGLIQICYE